MYHEKSMLHSQDIRYSDYTDSDYFRVHVVQSSLDQPKDINRQSDIILQDIL